MVELRRNILIAFSGGCFSGKTTTMNKLLSYLKDKGYPVEVIGERAREIMPQQYNGNIDLLRKNAKDYLKFEIDIISKKIQDEDNARAGESKKIYLIDRALSDSLFYLETYIDIKSLDLESAKEFTDFHKELVNLLAMDRLHYCNYRYDIVFEFEPIENSNNDDTFRPGNVDVIKHYEHNRIKRINDEFFTDIMLHFCRFDTLRHKKAKDIFEYVRSKVENYILYYEYLK